MKIAISQSNYIPWVGYFKLIESVDKFIFLDNVQYTRRDWRNRNTIKINNKKRWLTIPVQTKGKYKNKISEIFVCEPKWKEQHLSIIKENYKKEKYFNLIFPKIEEMYKEIKTENLSEINQHLIKKICSMLQIKTTLIKIEQNEEKKECASQRLLNICLNHKIYNYVTGSAAKSYLKEELFLNQNVKIEWFDYKKEIGNEDELKNSIIHMLMTDIDYIMKKFKFSLI